MEKALAYYILAIFGVQTIATYYSWYFAIRWLDIPMHIVTGGWVGLAAVHYFACKERSPIRVRNFWGALIVSVGAAAAIGILWEVFEFAIDIATDSYSPLFAPGYLHFDTLKDLIDDMFGAVVALGVAWKISTSLRARCQKKDLKF